MGDMAGGALWHCKAEAPRHLYLPGCSEASEAILKSSIALVLGRLSRQPAVNSVTSMNCVGMQWEWAGMVDGGLEAMKRC